MLLALKPTHHSFYCDLVRSLNRKVWSIQSFVVSMHEVTQRTTWGSQKILNEKFLLKKKKDTAHY